MKRGKRIRVKAKQSSKELKQTSKKGQIENAK